MVNDTTTLNGALTELGETMADNLESMGVLDADASDGLTTLASKILDIEPSVSGLNVDTNMSIHSSESHCSLGSQILFWAELTVSYDDETVADVDLSGVLTGATVQFKIGNTVIGTGVTDVNGIATYTHTFDTFGDFDVYAVFPGTDNFDDCQSGEVTISVMYNMNITSDKNILSYAAGDVATITACLSDDSGGVSGESLSWEILDKDENLLDSGSDVTDANGEIEFSYTSTGVGDISVIVYGMFLQEIYEVQDCRFYDSASTDRSSDYTKTNISTLTHSNGVYTVESNASSSLSNYSSYVTPTGITIPSHFEASIDMYFTTASTDIGHNLMASSNLSIQNSQLNGIVHGSYRVNKGIIVRPWDSNKTNRSDGACSSNTWYTFIMEYDGTDVTGTIKQGDTVVWTGTVSNLVKTISYISAYEDGGHNTYKFKNFKIKAL